MKMKIYTRIQMIVPVIFLGMMLVAAPGFATTYTFTGSGNWSSASNWSGNTIPPAVVPNGDNIVIDGTGTCVFNDPYDGSLFQMRGTMTINASKTMTLALGELRIESGIVNIYGVLNANNSSGFDYNNGIINIYGTINVPASDGFVSYNNGNVAIQEGGTLNVNGGSIYIRGSGSVAAGGFLTCSSGGTIIVYYLTLTNNGTITNGTGSTFHLESGTLNNLGTFTNNGSLTHWSGNVTGTGMLNGSGDFEISFTNPLNATLSPGNSPGCMVFDGDFTNSGTLEIELADGVACTNYDQVQVINGHGANLGGTINITFPSGVPSATTFTILTAEGGIVLNSPTINWPAGYTGSGAIVGNEYQVSFSLLPVELVHFGGRLISNKQVSLNWNTASETNNDYFEIQRSLDSKKWEAIGSVAGGGSTQAVRQYDFMDYLPLHGTNYYRLRQVDFDGKYEYSAVVSVMVGKTTGGIQFYPNPATEWVKLSIDENITGATTLRLYNSIGTLVKETVLKIESDNYAYDIDISNLPIGVFMAVLSKGDYIWMQKLLVE